MRDRLPDSCDLIRPETLFDVEARLRLARTKHPMYANNLFEALRVIRAELDELEQAIRYETEQRIRDEALDVAATVLRLLEGDVEKNRKVRA